MNIVNLAGGTAIVSFIGYARLEFSYPDGGVQPTSWLYGGVQFPLAQTSANTLLRDADPALFYALDFYKFVLGQHLGARFVADAERAKYRGSDGKAITSIVASAIAYNPSPFMEDAQFALPMLAIYRVSGTNKYRTVMKSEEWTTWECVLVLPPMTAAQSQLIQPIFYAAELLLQNRTEQSCDDAYTPPGGVQRQRWTQLAAINEVNWNSCEYGLFPAAKGLPMPFLAAKLLVSDLQGKYLGQPPFQGSSVSLGVYDNATQTTIDDVVDIDTWMPVPATI